MSGLQPWHMLAADRGAASVHTRRRPPTFGLRVLLPPEPRQRDAPATAEDGGAQHCILAVTGALDLAAIGAVQDNLNSLIRAGNVRLIVDLSRVRLCDAAAMGGLVQVGRRCAERGGWLRLAQPVGLVARVFRIVSLGLDVEIYPTVPAAVAGGAGDQIMR